MFASAATRVQWPRPHACRWHGSIRHSESRLRPSGPDPSEWMLRFDACDSTAGTRPTSHAHSIRLWVPRSVCGLARDTNQDYVVMDVQTWRLIDFALHSCGRFLVAWADFQGRFLEPPSAFCCLCQTSLGICICFVNVCWCVSTQPKMMIFKTFQKCSHLVSQEFRPTANIFEGGSLQCPAASETAVFPAGLQEGPASLRGPRVWEVCWLKGLQQRYWDSYSTCKKSCMFRFLSLVAGAAARGRCKVFVLKSFFFPIWSLVAGVAAAERCCCQNAGSPTYKSSLGGH